MSRLSLSMTITRDELGLDPLELNDGDTYIVAKEGLSPGEISWRREQVTSPYVHGSITTHRAKDSPDARIIVNVEAKTYSLLRSAISTLIEAFSQDLFTVTLEIEGTTYAWEGEAADYSVGFVQERFHGRNVPVGFQFPRHPIPVAGPF